MPSLSNQNSSPVALTLDPQRLDILGLASRELANDRRVNLFHAGVCHQKHMFTVSRMAVIANVAINVAPAAESPVQLLPHEGAVDSMELV